VAPIRACGATADGTQLEMGIFAFFCEDLDSLDFTLEELHINLWCLPSFGLRHFVCDVGFLLTGRALPQKGELWVPFEAGPAEDLYDKLVLPRVAEMVFGEVVTVTNAGEDHATISLSSHGDLTLCRLRPQVATRLDEVPDAWCFPLEWSAPTTGNRLYIRVRFPIHSMRSSWRWRREGGFVRRQGALVDLRFNDLRNFGSQAIHDFENKLVPVQMANVFLIVPSRFHLVESSPKTTRSRILERQAWGTYLGRSFSNRVCPVDGLVHYWRSAPEPSPPGGAQASPITLHQPYAVLARLGRGSALSIGEYTWIAVIVAVLLILLADLSRVGEAARSFFWDMPQLLWHIGVGLNLLLGTIFGVSLLGLWRWRTRARRGVQSARWAAEAAVYRAPPS
jgi:hypothetical protein